EETVIASSTSGILPTVLQEKCTRHPERMLVAHPFNPVYLMPLVELVGGEKTESKYIERARNFYDGIQMKPLIVRNEIEGDRKSTRLNSSHVSISYAVFCLKKKIGSA